MAVAKSGLVTEKFAGNRTYDDSLTRPNLLVDAVAEVEFAKPLVNTFETNHSKRYMSLVNGRF